MSRRVANRCSLLHNIRISYVEKLHTALQLENLIVVQKVLYDMDKG